MKKSSNYLLMADLHLSNKLPYSVPTDDAYKTDRFIHQLDLLKRIAAIGEKNEVDGYIVAGDLFDKSVVDPVTFFHVAEAFQKCFTAPVYILPGNHDSVTISGGPYITDIFPLLGMHVVTHNDTIFRDEFVHFYPLEYLSMDDSIAPLEELRQARDSRELPEVKNHVMLFHNSVIGAKNGNYTSDKGFGPAALLQGFDLALGGHYHEPHQVIKNVEYIGAPMQYHFGDCGKRNCVMLANFSNEGFELKRIELNNPKFFQYDDPDKINWLYHKGDYLRLTIESTVPELHEMVNDINELKATADKHGVHFFFQHNPVYQHSMRLDTNRDELSYVALIEDYVKSEDVNTGTLDEDKLVEYGQRFLKKAMDKNE